MAGRSRRYVALLRAINVGGRSVIRMADLRDLVESFGVEEVSTYIQTGNVLFSSERADARGLARDLGRHLGDALGREVTVFVLTPRELGAAAAANPFGPERMEGEWRSHVVFLSGSPTAAARRALMDVEGEDYRFAVRGRVLYYAYPREYEGRRRRAVDFERILGVAGTARNAGVVGKLVELAAGTERTGR